MIYFIRATGSGLVKIGSSVDPAKRLSALQIGCPDHLSIEATMPGNLRDERRLHARFANHRVRGEWFKISPSVVATMLPPKTTIRDGLPIVSGRMTSRDGVTLTCPHCREAHYHCGMVPGLNHRLAHCSGGRGLSYFVEIASP